uniref:Uncharacterized protein n=1 Tax=Rhizophagus irregularis (strain DAOM 181602 / DAOM 197198 / MUCL 43194) TaxID=747089 RepID=U9U6I5_RHIID
MWELMTGKRPFWDMMIKFNSNLVESNDNKDNTEVLMDFYSTNLVFIILLCTSN